MKFIVPKLSIALSCLHKLNTHNTPEWGTLTAIGMVEHLTDSLNMASASPQHQVEIPEKYWNKMLDILKSDVEIPKNFKANFAPENRIIRSVNLNVAIEEFEMAWKYYQDVFLNDMKLKTNHPYYGPLNKVQWDRLLSKHLTHHFKQFDILPEAY